MQFRENWKQQPSALFNWLICLHQWVLNESQAPIIANGYAIKSDGDWWIFPPSRIVLTPT